MIHNCDLCDCADSAPLPVNAAYTAPEPPPVICTNCGFVYVRERRSSPEIAQAWDDIYSSEGYDPDWPGVRARLYYVAEFLNGQHPLKGKSVLDIGAGKGVFLEYVRDVGAVPTAVEPYLENVRLIMGKNIRCHHGTSETFAAGMENLDGAERLDQSYDVVTILWTLENCGDALAMLRAAHTLLKPHGRVVVATGSRLLVPFKKPLSAYLSNSPADTHCFRWSANSLCLALHKTGFRAKIWNDFDQRDELVVIAEKKGPADDGEPIHDDPQSVSRFFRSWQEQFP